MRAKIEVTERDIEMGKPGWKDSCPIALAVCRTFEKTQGSVQVSDVLCMDGREYALPKKAIRFINRFDDGKSVKSFSFYAAVQLTTKEASR